MGKREVLLIKVFGICTLFKPQGNELKNAIQNKRLHMVPALAMNLLVSVLCVYIYCSLINFACYILLVHQFNDRSG